MILCIGPSSTGKTLLLRKLQHKEIYIDPLNENFDTVRTVGTNIVTLRLGKKNIRVIELGGAMAPIWHNHYDTCPAIIFVIDSCNFQQVSCAGILLLEVLSHPLLEKAKFLIVFNKTDLKSSISLQEMKCLLRIGDICQYAKQEISVIETSCYTGRGLKDIKDWLSQFCTK